MLRACLTMKLVSLGILMAITVVGSRSCSGGTSPTSPLNPAQLLRNGLSGLCGNQTATDTAGGDAGPTGADPTLTVPATQAALAQVAGLSGSALACPTTTVPDG